ncbi:cyclin-domain-containing protein [Lipomyces kononenkoae]
MPPSSPFSLAAAHLYPFSFPTPPPELPLSSVPTPTANATATATATAAWPSAWLGVPTSSSSSSSYTVPGTADLAQYRLRSHVPSINYNRYTSTLSSPPPRQTVASNNVWSSAECDNTFAPVAPASSPPSEVLVSPAPLATLATLATTNSRAMSPSPSPDTTNEDKFASMAANISCLFWFTPTQTLVHCASSAAASSTHNARLPLLSPVCLATPEFKLFAAAMLSRTQVSRTVVALALLYIYRLKLHSPTILGTPGSEYRVFTIALVLANKFLDDNTYTNKTWAQVSKLPVSEIGVMEVEFLKHIDYDLAVSNKKWSEWSDLLACFARARNAARFACVSLPGSPVTRQPPPPSPALPLLQSPPLSGRTSRKRKIIFEDDILDPSPGPGHKRLYAPVSQPQHTSAGLYYSPTPASFSVDPQAALAVGALPVLPKPKGVVLPLTPTLAYPGTAMRPVPVVPGPSIDQIPLLVKNTYAIPATYTVPGSLSHPVPPAPAPAPVPASARALAAVQPAARANPFIYPVVDKHYVPVPRLLSVKQLHPGAITDLSRW